MKLRPTTPRFDEAAERELQESVRKISDQHGSRGEDVPDAYWQNLIVRTNRQIDEVSSGKAITISWAARVAIPGVVAILSFLIGLYYYTPELMERTDALADVIVALPNGAADSLFQDYPLKTSAALEVVEENMLDVSTDQMRDYFIEEGGMSSVLEALTDDQVSEVLTLLESSTNSSDG
jgi:hypothetical protein